MARSNIHHGMPANKVIGKMALYKNMLLLDYQFFFNRNDRQLKMAQFNLIINNAQGKNKFDIIIAHEENVSEL